MSVSTLEPAVERIHDHGPSPTFSPARLRAARQLRNLTVGQLAEAVGRDPRTVRRYQAGELLPPLSAVCVFATVLRVPICDLFE